MRRQNLNPTNLIFLKAKIKSQFGPILLGETGQGQSNLQKLEKLEISTMADEPKQKLQTNSNRKHRGKSKAKFRDVEREFKQDQDKSKTHMHQHTSNGRKTI